MNWAGLALRRVEAGEPTALVTVVGAQGSTPRESGARMLVGESYTAGTIGGGALEWRATDQARRLLRQAARDYAVQDYPLGPLLQQCCGGRVRLLLERIGDDSRDWLDTADMALQAGRPFALEVEFGVRALTRTVRFEDDQWPGLLASSSIRLIPRSAEVPAKRAMPEAGDRLVERIAEYRPGVAVFGAGHVGRALARVLAPLPLRLSVYDLRPEASAPGVEIMDEAALVQCAGAGADFVLVMTHSHDLDYLLVRAALSCRCGYVGLIGSATKRARFLSRLRADGLDEADIARLVCPIGLPSLKSKAPEVIAIGVAADLLQRIEAADGI